MSAFRFARGCVLAGLLGCGGDAATADDGCVIGGCANEICADHSSVSTCEEKPHADCYASARCARQASGTCGWDLTDDLERCLAE